MKIKTSEAMEVQLNYLVSRLEGTPYILIQNGVVYERGGQRRYAPCTDWEEGGPIIEREDIGLWSSTSEAIVQPSCKWFAEKRHYGKHHKAGRSYAEGPTPLIAAMRCYVASKLGDIVEIPDELGG